jgi:ATP-binding protein involved in chromosome partitioning
MSGFECPHCHEEIDVFGKDGGERLARDMGIPFLGSIPLDPAVRRAGDAGEPTVISAPESPAAQALMAIAATILHAVRNPQEEEELVG